MAEFFENEDKKERVILVGVRVSEKDDTDISLLELEELVRTAGAEAVGTVVQNREAVHPGTYIGKGKIEEVKEQLIVCEADGIICDDELSPAQMKNLEDALECKVMDRTMLILDIFAQHAKTAEGKLQVELAQLRYRATRLIGSHSALSRIGGGAAGATGGIGTRGPGEKKLEIDRRLIKARISSLNRELEQVKKNREIARMMREKNRSPVVAIVGYTNAGKSTLLNTLTDAGVLSENKLFATLDTTTRAFKPEGGEQILLTDTVGFIRKLPHHLVDAFRSTLEEAKYADLILHVVDASNPDMDAQMHIVYETLEKLGVKDKPVVTAFNKQDLLEHSQTCRDFRADKTVRISAKRGDGLTELLDGITELLRASKIYTECVIPYADGSKLNLIRKYGQLLSEEYVAEGTKITAYLPKDLYGQLFGESGNSCQ